MNTSPPVWLLLAVAAIGVQGWGAVKVVGEAQAVRMPASKDTGAVTLLLESTTTERVTLRSGEVRSKEKGETLPATVTFDPVTVDLKPNQATPVKVTVAQMFAEGEATVEIRIQGAKLADLVIQRFGAGLQLQQKQAEFRRARATAIQIRNETQFPYTVGWMMQIDAVKVCGQGPDRPCEVVENWKRLEIPARNTATVEVEPPGTWFERWLPQTKPARLTLAFGQANAAGQLIFPAQLPKVEIQLEARLAGALGQTLWILLLLLAGGLLSLLVRHWVPNSRRKRDLKEQIQRVHLKIGGISGEVDSVLRVLVRVERLALDARRKSMLTIFPDYETVAAQCAKGIATLERRVDLIEEIDSIHDWINGQWELYPPPSRIDSIYGLLKQASELLKKLEPLETDFVRARELIDKAKGLIGALRGEDAEFGMELLQRLEVIRKEWEDLSNTLEGKQVKGAVEGPFAVLSGTAPTQLAPDQHHWYDTNLMALAMLRDYVRLLRRSSNPEFVNGVGGHGREFLADVSCLSWDKLRAARLKLRQMQEGVYVEDLAEAIRNGEVKLVMDPPRVKPQRPVMFSVSFRRPEMNWSAALEQIQCEWDFGRDQLSERGNVVAHYFERAREDDRVSVKFSDAGGKEMPGDKVEPLNVLPFPQEGKEDSRTRSFHEFVGMGVSLVVPLLGLVGGAQGELQKDSVMGALGVFLLGYSADTIKSVFAQRTQPPQ